MLGLQRLPSTVDAYAHHAIGRRALSAACVSLAVALCTAVPLVAQQGLRPGKVVFVDVPPEVSAALDEQLGPRRPSAQASTPLRIRSSLHQLMRPLQASVSTPRFDDSALPDDRRFDQVTFVTAHNAFTASADGWIYAQQALTIPEQLKLGVRGLMLDIYPSNNARMGELCFSQDVPKFRIERVCSSKKVCRDVEKKKKVCRKVCGGWDLFGGCAWFADLVCEWVTDGVETLCEDAVPNQCVDVPKQDGTQRISECLPDPETCVYSGERRARLCHEMEGTSTCSLTPTKLAPGKNPRTLASSLKEVKTFLDANPKAIITLFLESKVTDPSLLLTEFTDAGIAAYIYRKQANVAWPTLKAMRDSGKRLVVFANNGLGVVSNNWDHVVETQYDLTKYQGCEIRTETQKNVRKVAEVPLLTINHFYPIALDQPWLPERVQPFDALRLKQRISLCGTEVGRKANFIALDFVDRAAGVWPLVSALNAAP